MTPYYSQDGITIYHGDCRDLMPSIGRFDLLLTDPPYGIGVTRNGTTGGGGSTASKYRQWECGEWDVRDPQAVNLAIQLCDHAIVWGGNYYSLPPSTGWLVWNKMQRGFSLADAELAWTNLAMAVRVFDLPRSPALYRQQQHPTQKPDALIRWCLRLAGATSTILDPFAGSGTTGRAAKDAGLPAVLIEIEERYYEIAAKRLSQAVLPLSSGATVSEDTRDLLRDMQHPPRPDCDAEGWHLCTPAAQDEIDTLVDGFEV